MKVIAERKSRFILVLFLSVFINAFGQETPKFKLTELPSLPNANKDVIHLGYAGMLGGIHNGSIIAAGGANFLEGFPWEGGKKVWSDVIYIFENNKWQIAGETLPKPLAYGASVQLPNGILCIGGNNSKRTSNKVFLITYEPSGKKIKFINYPDLPEPLAYTAAVLEGGYVYIIGGKNSEQSTNVFYRMSLDKKQWEKLPDFPGLPRAVHTAVIQESQHSRKLFVIGGRNQVAGQKSVPLTNFLSYNFEKEIWKDEGNVTINGKPKVLMGAISEATGSMHIMVYGGSNEMLFNKLEQIGLQLKKASNDSIITNLTKKRNDILNNHPGFSKEILTYNTITNKWFVYDTLAKPFPVTTLAFKSKEDIVIVSGEISPGIRTAKVQKLSIENPIKPFGVLNYLVLAGYLLLSLIIGFYFSYKQKSSNDYFVGGGRIPWWASGLSVFGTLLSAITFMAIPAKTFITDWSFFMLNMTAILITPIISLLFIPFFNKLKIKTAYAFLERRFNYLARAFGSLSFIIFQFGRIGIVLLLPSLAISIVTGIPVGTSIFIMSILCVLYTTFGGIEAVIWTDVMQVIVLLGGSVFAVFWIVFHTEASFGEMISYASKYDKFNIVNMKFDFTQSTFWTVFIGGLASALVTQGTDQTIVQRYMTSSDIKNSRKTLYTNAFLTLPASIIFFGLGTLLFIFYSEMPDRLSPAISNNDSIFPWYIVRELPVGISGLLVAGIFSAAMSSVSSSLNSVSVAFCEDFYKHFYSEISDKKLLNIARVATVVTGLIGMLLALWMANSNINSLWDQFYRILGLFTGGLGGMFLLGMLTKKANAKGTLLGLVFSAVFIWYISLYTHIHFLMYSFLGLASCFVFGYIFSLIFRSKENSPDY